MPAHLLALLLAQAQPLPDTDLDGLPDAWETDGFGPVQPATHGCKPGRTDVFIVFVPRDKTTPEALKPTVERVVAFYAALPNTNPDGSRGVHAIPIVLPNLKPEQDATDYRALYETAMPKQWRGIGHGVVVEPGTGGGGQTNRPDWCVSSNRWHTIVHELGHQFGLGHGPQGGQTGSPFHTSLMNYDYSYQFNGSGNAVHYSSGQFLKLRMKESDLNERVPVPAPELEFLTKRPYYFNVKPVDESSADIDWNRNGLFGENHVRADVNDGYSCGLDSSKTHGLASGSPSLAAFGPHLALVTPVLPPGDGYTNRAWRPTPERPAKINVALLAGQETVNPNAAPQDAFAPATGELSVAATQDRLFIVSPVQGGHQLVRLQKTANGFASPHYRFLPASQEGITVVTTPKTTLLVKWEPDTNRVSVATWDSLSFHPIPGLTSTVQPAATWNQTRNTLAVAATKDQDKKPGRLTVSEIDPDTLALVSTIWVEGEAGGAATAARPTLLFDASKDRGPNGGYNVYFRGRTAKPNEQAVNHVARQTEDKARSDGWRTRMLGNEWAFGMDTPTAAFYQGDIAYAYRLAFSDNAQKINLSLKASGIEDKWLTDFDEVTFITKTGFQNSLKAVQKEIAGLGSR